MPEGLAPIPAPRTSVSQNSDDTNSNIDSEVSLINSKKKTNRIWPRAKYAMQQRSFILPATSSFLITAYLSCSYLYRLFYLKETVDFINYVKSFQTWPLIAISSVLATISLCTFIHNYRNTESPTVHSLDDLSNVVSNDNLVHDIKVYKKNNDLIKFKNKSYAGHRNIPDFTYKKLKLANERVLFNVCLSTLITTGSIYPLTKYLQLGPEGFIKSFSFSGGKEELIASKFFSSARNRELIIVAAVLTVLTVSLVCMLAYYHNKKTDIEPLKFDILVNDNIEVRNNRYCEEVKGKCKEISTEIETIVIRHYNDNSDTKGKITILAL
ncbi:hypothetical protein [Wolbachia endosymbiont of Ctenocephalides felis wCfeJ]|uniref:hypothetical protein n=1 Tax=Wolbachia endosymbiont of Ctenocephalides felis wCfeJ TaxID=2732594 RepID=UPI0014463406|nr:hypothetical protein [Wolbachia endosymbiont of Ctenocephalides felis wCfeJ]WCR58076.1 MAG: hypothetical protein PG980_000548 [Wolbachia endosymbiont of Ctenocephalides felis wCfeJ]